MMVPRAGVVVLVATAALAAVPDSDGNLDYSKAGEDWQALCNSDMQSPIDVEPDEVMDSDVQARVLYGLWEAKDIEVAESFGKVPRLTFKTGSSPGMLLLGTRYGDFDEYELTSIEVHAPSEHTFAHATWPVELQLWHRPMPLVRISELEQQMAKIGEKSKAFDEQLQQMAEANEKLLEELTGASSPWESTVGKDDAETVAETLDWLDASKSELAAQASEVHRHTVDQLHSADNLAQAVDKLVAAQERELANHHVVISLFVRRMTDPMPHASAHRIVEWITQAIKGNHSQPDGLDMRGILTEAVGSRPLISYPGSLNRPPCTPNVRWLLTDRPIPARMEHIEELIRATLLRDPNGGFLDDGVIGDSRETQSGGKRRLERVALFGADFAEPVIKDEDLLAEDAQKWIRISRYTKLFCASSFGILCTPCLFMLMRACGFSDVGDGEDVE